MPEPTRLRPGSRTQTETSTPVLRLRATAPTSQETRRPRIQWADDVVDNEGLGRKKSKVCCIYHRPRAVDESSSDSSPSSSDESSDSEAADENPRRRTSINDDGRARMAGAGSKKGKQRSRPQEDHHEHADNDDPHGCADQSHNHKEAKVKNKKAVANAYERTPKQKGGSSTTTMEVKR